MTELSDELSHPDHSWALHYVIRITYHTTIYHLDDLAEVDISSGWVMTMLSCHPGDIRFHIKSSGWDNKFQFFTTRGGPSAILFCVGSRHVTNLLIKCYMKLNLCHFFSTVEKHELKVFVSQIPSNTHHYFLNCGSDTPHKFNKRGFDSALTKLATGHKKTSLWRMPFRPYPGVLVWGLGT